MSPEISSTIITEEHAPGLYRLMGIYAPFVWVAVRLIWLGQRVGIISPEAFRLCDPEIMPHVFQPNRQLRRGEASCLRRARRQVSKGRKLKRELYVPRAYAYLSYFERMDKSAAPAQFKERYLRHNNISRVQVYGLDHAHEVTAFVRGTRDALLATETALSEFSPLSLAAPADPAPP